jgi:hypothetical protein
MTMDRKQKISVRKIILHNFQNLFSLQKYLFFQLALISPVGKGNFENYFDLNSP